MIMKIISSIYTYKIHSRFSYYWDTVYTAWIRCFIGKVGRDSRFARPLVLQGGGARNIAIGSRTKFGAHCVLGSWAYYNGDHYEPSITIGDDCSIGEFCHISSINRISIGNGLLTGRFVYIGDNSHGGLSLEEAKMPPSERKLESKGAIEIGNNVWIGDKATILGGVTIGDNVIVGAGSVVTHNIPSNTLVVGAPAKIVKQLNK